MRAASRLSLLILLLSIACSRAGDERAVPPGATPEPHTTAHPSTSSSPGDTPAASISVPAPTSSPEPGEEEGDEFDDPFESAFQLAVTVSQYFGPIPMTVDLQVRARNGTPPYSFTWDFGDGTAQATGEAVTHTYTTLGRINTFVHGRDAAGETYTIQIILFVTTLDEYTRQKGLPLDASPPTPVPASPEPAASATSAR